MEDFELVIGIEVHAELSTKAKAFCDCKVDFDSKPNTNICPICLGLPGALPKLNEQVLDFALKAGLSLNCEINKISKQDRKHYFYPDLGKGYQVTQDVPNPIVKNGYIEITKNDGTKKKIRINRIQMEEDTAKVIYDPFGRGMLLDFNRSSVPLLEIISEPDISSKEEAVLYLEKLREILKYINVSDCKMEEGSFRGDINISVNRKGEPFGNRIEIKNMSSFKSIDRAIDYEFKRQVAAIKNGKVIKQETLGWDDVAGKTYSMRSKENKQDYRYFPDGGLPQIIVDQDKIDEIKREIPELPDAKRERYIKEYNLTDKQIEFILSDRVYIEFFEGVLKKVNDPVEIANWMMSELARLMNENMLEPKALPITVDDFASFISLILDNTLNSKTAKIVIEEMFNTSKKPKEIIEEKGLSQITDKKALVQIVKDVLDENKQSVEDYKNGKDRAFGFLIGQIMKKSKGKANPKLVNEILAEELGK